MQSRDENGTLNPGTFEPVNAYLMLIQRSEAPIFDTDE
jgi:hypothetical protein